MAVIAVMTNNCSNFIYDLLQYHVCLVIYYIQKVSNMMMMMMMMVVVYMQE